MAIPIIILMIIVFHIITYIVTRVSERIIDSKNINLQIIVSDIIDTIITVHHHSKIA